MPRAQTNGGAGGPSGVEEGNLPTGPIECPDWENETEEATERTEGPAHQWMGPWTWHPGDMRSPQRQATALLEGGFPGAGFLTCSSQEHLDRDVDAVEDVEDTGLWEATVHGGWCHVPGEAEERGPDLRQEHSPTRPSPLRALSKPGRQQRPPAAGEKQHVGDRAKDQQQCQLKTLPYLDYCK